MIQLSIVREYLIMCSTVWTMCMALDLYYLVGTVRVPALRCAKSQPLTFLGRVVREL